MLDGVMKLLGNKEYSFHSHGNVRPVDLSINLMEAIALQWDAQNAVS